MTDHSLQIRPVEADGFSAWLAEDHSVPVVSLAWSWQGGAALDAKGHEGTLAMAAALMTEGAGTLDATQFSDALRDDGIQLGFQASADEFSGSFRALTSALPQAVELTAQAMNAPAFAPEAVERVRSRALLGARRAQETPQGRAGRSFWEQAWPHHPAGRRSAGTTESLPIITSAEMRSALAGQLRRQGLLIAASGAITPEGLALLLPQLFGGLTPGQPAPLPALPPMAAFGQHIVPMEVPQSAVIFGQDGIPPEDPDWETAQLVLRILGSGGFSSRLMQAVREERGLSYGIRAGMQPAFGRGIILGSVATENARVAETLAVTRTEWARMGQEGPTADEIQDAVAYMTGSLPLSFTESRRIAELLLGLRRNGRPLDWLQGRAERLRALDTAACARVAARLLHGEELRVVVAGAPLNL